MKQICDDAIRLLESGESFVQATILQSSGSVPRGEGACMLILNGGDILGTVGGGSLEGGIIKAAPDVFNIKRPRVIEMLLDGNDTVAVGMICGGQATVLVDYIDCNHPGNLEFFTALKSALKSGMQAQLVTALPGAESDAVYRSQCLLTPEGEPVGTNGFYPNILKAVQERHSGYDVFTQLENQDIFLHRIGTDGIAYIFGAGHCGQKLAHVLHTVGFGTVIVDDREEFANRERFPNADKILAPESMDLPFNDIAFNSDSYIVIVTRGHKQDELVLRHSLRTNAGYVGMIGSRGKRESIYERLLADGYTQAELDTVYSPIGLPIGADTPEEIAVSIAAELIKARAERRGG
ncbi:MAG: XdhC family protein [Oscillospiraceae bacterium]|nr:XdhC family protein [Oscillospiraceae bacterium]